MKAISLWQPWASLVAVGAKEYETRSWPTSYRGPLVIHAAKRWTPLEVAAALDPHFKSALKAAGLNPTHLPLGAALCVVDLVDVVTTESVRWDIDSTERAFGNYTDGRFAWKLANIRTFDVPIPWLGHQGLWDYGGPLREGMKP